MSENESSKRLTITDIESKSFRCTAYGYEQREVDEFLDSICDELELLQAEIDDLKHRLDFANAETRKAEAASGFVPPAVTAPEDSFREILEMAKEVKDKTIADAKVKAEEIIAAAQAQADAELGGLKAAKADLEGVVDALRAKARDYRDAVVGLIRNHQDALAQIDLGEEEA